MSEIKTNNEITSDELIQVTDTGDHTVVTYVTPSRHPDEGGEVYLADTNFLGDGFVDTLIEKSQDRSNGEILLERDHNNGGSWKVSEKTFADAIQKPEDFGLIMEPSSIVGNIDPVELGKALEYGKIEKVDKKRYPDGNYMLFMSELAGGEIDIHETKHGIFNLLIEEYKELDLPELSKGVNREALGNAALTEDYVNRLNDFENGKLFNVASEIYEKGATDQNSLRTVIHVNSLEASLDEATNLLSTNHSDTSEKVEKNGVEYEVNKNSKYSEEREFQM